MPDRSRRIVLFLATGAGAGYLPAMPGTFGTIAGMPVSLAINWLGTIHPAIAIIAMATLIYLSVFVADRAAQILAAKDPQVVVIDEIAGFALANFLNRGAGETFAALVLFRIFDIAKVFPGRRLEAYPGGAGIVLDDLVAAMYTLFVVRSLLWIGWL